MFKEEEFEPIKDPETDFIIDPIISGEDEILAYGIYSKLRIYLFHYNSIKTKYKVLCLTWLVSTFVGIGYVLSGETTTLPIATLPSIALITLLSSVGILLICFLDIAVYHRLIEAIFMETIELENNFPFLSKTSHIISKLLTKGSTGPVIFDAFFYVSFTAILLVCGILSMYVYLNPLNHHYAILFLGFSFVLLFIVEFVIVMSARESGLKRLYRKRKS